MLKISVVFCVLSVSGVWCIEDDPMEYWDNFVQGVDHVRDSWLKLAEDLSFTDPLQRELGFDVQAYMKSMDRCLRISRPERGSKAMRIDTRFEGKYHPYKANMNYERSDYSERDSECYREDFDKTVQFIDAAMRLKQNGHLKKIKS